MSNYFKRAVSAIVLLYLTACASTPSDRLEHVRYEVNGKTVDKQTYDREFQKNPGSVAECSRNSRTGETLCAGG